MKKCILLREAFLLVSALLVSTVVSYKLENVNLRKAMLSPPYHLLAEERDTSAAVSSEDDSREEMASDGSSETWVISKDWRNRNKSHYSSHRADSFRQQQQQQQHDYHQQRNHHHHHLAAPQHRAFHPSTFFRQQQQLRSSISGQKVQHHYSHRASGADHPAGAHHSRTAFIIENDNRGSHSYWLRPTWQDRPIVYQYFSLGSARPRDRFLSRFQPAAATADPATTTAAAPPQLTHSEPIDATIIIDDAAFDIEGDDDAVDHHALVQIEATRSETESANESDAEFDAVIGVADKQQVGNDVVPSMVASPPEDEAEATTTTTATIANGISRTADENKQDATFSVAAIRLESLDKKLSVSVEAGGVSEVRQHAVTDDDDDDNDVIVGEEEEESRTESTATWTDASAAAETGPTSDDDDEDDKTTPSAALPTTTTTTLSDGDQAEETDATEAEKLAVTEENSVSVSTSPYSTADLSMEAANATMSPQTAMPVENFIIAPLRSRPYSTLAANYVSGTPPSRIGDDDDDDDDDDDGDSLTRYPIYYTPWSSPSRYRDISAQRWIAYHHQRPANDGKSLNY